MMFASQLRVLTTDGSHCFPYSCFLKFWTLNGRQFMVVYVDFGQLSLLSIEKLFLFFSKNGFLTVYTKSLK